LRRALEVKRDGGALDEATWTRIIEGYVDGSVEEACVAALAMAGSSPPEQACTDESAPRTALESKKVRARLSMVSS